MDTVLIIIGTVNAVLLIIILVKLFFGGKQEIDTGSIVSSVKDGLNASQRELREEMSGSVQKLRQDNGGEHYRDAADDQRASGGPAGAD